MERVANNLQSSQQKTIKFDAAELVSSNLKAGSKGDANFKSFLSSQQSTDSRTSSYDRRDYAVKDMQNKDSINTEVKSNDTNSISGKDAEKNSGDKTQVNKEVTKTSDGAVKGETKSDSSKKGSGKEQRSESILGGKEIAAEKPSQDDELTTENMMAYIRGVVNFLFGKIKENLENKEELTPKEYNKLLKSIDINGLGDLIQLMNLPEGEEVIIEQALLEIKQFSLKTEKISIESVEQLQQDVMQKLGEVAQKLINANPAKKMEDQIKLFDSQEDDEPFDLMEAIKELKSEGKRDKIDTLDNSEKLISIKPDLNVQKALNQFSFQQQQFNMQQQFGNEFLDAYAQGKVNISGHSISQATTQVQTNRAADYIEQIQNYSKIIDEIKIAHMEKKDTIQLKLEPATLGKLTVKLSSESGAVNATFFVENNKAKQALEEQMAELRASLTSQGVDISNLDVQLENETQDFNMHKNILEALNYSYGLDFANMDEEDFIQAINPYIDQNIFSDVI